MILPNTIQNVYVTMIAAIVISLAMIPSWLSGLLIIAAIASINIGENYEIRAPPATRQSIVYHLGRYFPATSFAHKFAGVVGYMTLWGVNLDCISMITIDMSVGLAVDLTAHISYAYVSATGTPKQRVVTAMETVAWPVLQVRQGVS